MIAFDSQDLAQCLGLEASQLSPKVVAMVTQAGLRYRKLSPEERDAAILKLLEEVDSGKFAASGPHRQNIWEMAWADRAAAFRENEGALEHLRPNYMGGNVWLRLNQDYVAPEPEDFQNRFSQCFRQALFEHYLSAYENIYEFGCGSGFNLTQLAQTFPSKTLLGLDWTQSAVDLVQSIGERHGLKIQGRRFDFVHPDAELSIPPNTAVLTMCALEQVGLQFEPFLDFLLQRRPALCVHMEPIVEFYDPKNLVDYLGLRYHNARNYLGPFLTVLRGLAEQKRLEIVVERRVSLGDFYHEGYSHIIWRPLP